jgi:hypothetical protein
MRLSLPKFTSNKRRDVKYNEKKTVPCMGCPGPWGCEMLRLPHFLDTHLTDGGEIASLMHRLPFIYRKIPGIQFLRV